MRFNRVFAIFALIVTSGFVVLADEETKTVKTSDAFLTVRLVDEDGKPVADAQVGFYYFCNRVEKEWKFRPDVKSDKDGLAKLFEREEQLSRLNIYARQMDRRLVAVQNEEKADSDKVLNLVMRPECHVTYQLSCRQMEILGRKPGYVGSGVKNNKQYFIQERLRSFDSTFDVYLPPGVFVLAIGGEHTHEVEHAIEIQNGQRELDLGTIDLPATKMALLIGQPAPELHDCVEWKNGPPLKLAELRGKVILLEFWGYWCGGCVYQAIPEMFKLQEEYRGRDLVIIGIHVDTEDNEAGTVEKLDEKLAGIRKNEWKGKDISFPVALAPVKRTSYGTGVERKARTELSAEYGVIGYPTTVLIDQEGKVVGSYYVTLKEDNAKLRERLTELLDVPGDTAQ